MRLHKLNKFKKIKSNRFGRDFVIGDLHGNYEALLCLLSDVDFNYDYDRLFSVGDLIDRGPDSVRCLSLLNEPYFFAVRGNHEDIFCQMVKQDFKWFTLEQYWNIQNGGAWTIPYFEAGSEDLQYWYKQLVKLPMVLEIEGRNHVKPFWVVHAELSHKYHVLTPENLASHLENATTNDISTLLWSRRFYKKGQMPPDIGFPGPVYCGHTPVNAPHAVCGHINLDGGAGKSSDEQTSKLVLCCHTTGEYFYKSL